jgi:hypothetical protein
VATTHLLRELGIASREATAAAATNRAFLKAPTPITCRSDMVNQPSRMRLHTLTYGTGRWLDRLVRASAVLAKCVRSTHACRYLQPCDASIMVKQRYGIESRRHRQHVPTHGVFFPRFVVCGKPMTTIRHGYSRGGRFRAAYYDSIHDSYISHCPSSCPHSCYA